MPFTIDDFQDLIRLLEQRPEWRAELRRLVLSEELLDLPVAQARTEQALATLTERVDALTQRLDALTQQVGQLAQEMATLTRRVDALTLQVGALAEAQARTEHELGTLTRRVTDLRGSFRGAELERRYQQSAPAYFGRFARGLRSVDRSTLADLLEDAGLPEEERREVLLADLVLSGRRREDGRSIYLVVEISVGVGRHDVERAAARAEILRGAMEKRGEEQVAVVAVVAGESIDARGRALATARGVWQVRDGHITPPSAS